MALHDIARRLRVTFGLATESLPSTALESAVAERARALGLSSSEAYAESLRSDETELARLMDLLVVPETWFFREMGAFRELGAKAQQALASLPSKVFRVLSAPCSSGEEPYSIAMMLLDLGISPHKFQVDAVDISRSALTTAERGVYRAHSFRTPDSDYYKARFFETRGGEFVLSREVRDCVRLVQANLADPLFLAHELPYQVIFCRNALIYLHENARLTALASLHRVLAESGVLLAGHAEALERMSQHFRRAGSAAGFSFVKRTSSNPPPSRPAASRPAPSRPSHQLAPASERSPLERNNDVQRASTPPPAPPLIKARPSTVPPPLRGRDVETIQRELERANDFARRGELERASVICERLLKQHGPDPGTYYLLGCIRIVQNRHSDAETYFGRVLYLQPLHRRALLELADLSEFRGDHEQAREYRRRAGSEPPAS